ncbi:hypothetical protein HOG48_00920 [Candidatus Peregrinibacteria bacterium]|jgi:hypothetical protein|nr:hypothetical protein [Candidatus Peregrinibacteria bacterium]
MITKKCKITGASFTVSDKEIETCEVLGIPLPDIGPIERIRQTMSARNEWKLYHRKCDATGERILSAYHEDSSYTVYKNEIWWGDSWEGTDYGRDFDFDRPFFEQFIELQQVAPREGTSIFNCENCDYNSHARTSRNSYLSALMVNSEDVYYSYWTPGSKDIFDSAYSHDSELFYWCTHVENSYGCVCLEESGNCHDCCFSFQLRGCKNCLFCSNLVNKEYHIFNKPCSEKEFEEMKFYYLNGSYERWQEAYQRYIDMRKSALHRGTRNLRSENVVGQHLFDCKNCFNSYESYGGCEDCEHCVSLGDSKDVYSGYSVGWPAAEVVHTSSTVRGCTNVAYSMHVWFCNNIRYCDGCVNCEHCFGCVSLHRKKYCILNKQYSEQEYFEILPKIIEHMKKPIQGESPSKAGPEYGLFFPPEAIPFAYNETCAQDFLPLAEVEATSRGLRWLPRDGKEYKPATITNIPDNVNDIDESICNEVLACSDTGKNYRIIKKELAFYKKMGIPLPRQCPERRHQMRFSLINHQPYLFRSACSKCGEGMYSTYGPDREEAVYCDKCYLEEVY